MVIAIVVDSYNDRSNGTSMTAFRFARELVKRGHEVRIIATHPKYSQSYKKDSKKSHNAKLNLENLDSKKDCKDHTIGDYGEKLYFVKERYIPLVTEVSHKQHMIFASPDKKVLERALRGCDIAHFYLPFALEIAGVHLCRKLKIPYITAFHLQPQHISYNMNFNVSFFNKYLFRRFFRHFYRYAHHIHCPSKLMQKELEHAKYTAKMYVISNGFELKNATLPRIIESKSEIFNIISVGRFSKEKRQDVLIKAISKSKYAKNIFLHLHGIGPKERYLKALCDKYLSTNYEFGFIDNSLLLEKLAKMDLYVHAAEVESEAISCLEAVSLGVVPLIADSKISATTQFALDSRSLFRLNDTKDLASKIDFWIENRAILESMKPQYAQSAKNYALQKSIDSILQVYNEAINDFKTNPKLFEKINK